MSAWGWSATVLLLAVATVVLPILRLWDWLKARSVQRQTVHAEWIQQILGSDREVQEFTDMARRVVREHEGKP